MVNPNPTPRTEAYESGILAQLIKNAERLAVIESQNSLITSEIQKIGDLEKKTNELGQKTDELENKINVIYDSLKWLFTMLGTILLAIIANIFSQPILNLLG